MGHVMVHILWDNTLRENGQDIEKYYINLCQT